MAQRRPQSAGSLVKNEPAYFTATLSVIEAHGDPNFPKLCFVIGRLVSTDRVVRTVEQDPLMPGDVVVASVGKPFNPHQDSGRTPHGSGSQDLTRDFPKDHLVRFAGCELLNDNEIEAKSFQLLTI